jgi:molecular chaperone GrpE
MSTKRKIPINDHSAAETAESVAERTEQVQDTSAGSADAAGFAPSEQPDAADVPEAEDEAATALAKLTAERDELSDALLRLRAEFENFRRRSARELVESRQRAQGELLHDLLPVLDNLERALDAAEHHEESKVLGGVRLTKDMFVDLLKRAGVEEIEGVDSTFDPVMHEAMLMQPSDKEEGVVTAVLQKGYRQGDRVLRPARVAVSSGPQTA